MWARLRELQRKAGAEFALASGREQPRHYGDWRREWAAVRKRCGLLDVGFRDVCAARGEDRVSFLQGMVTTDLARLQPGQGAYGAILTIQGRVVSDVRLLALSDEIWLDLPRSHAERAREHLQRHIVADDVELVSEEAWAPLLAFEGPQAGRVALAVFGQSLSDLPWLGHRLVDFDGSPVRVLRATHTGENGYTVFGPADVAPWLWERSVAAGAEPVGLEALEALRIEAGIPWVGRDMDETTLIMEVGLDEAITFGKGCYLGQEVVERVAARGQIQRRRVGLLALGSGVPPPGAPLQRGDREVGKVTSSAWSPALEAGIAMGYVRREAWDEGTELEVVEAAEPLRVRVVSLPLIRSGTNVS